MKHILLGFTIGIVTGAMALRKMEKSDIPEQVLKTAQKKLKG